MKPPFHNAARQTMRVVRIAALFCWAVRVWAVANGSLSGTIRDPSGSVIEGARITLANVAHNSTYSTVSNAQGYYSFPALPVGRYDMTIEAAGFKTEKKTDL